MISLLKRSLLILLGGLFSGSFVYAQDSIIFKNGTEISAKVLEVAPGQIKYRRQDNPDGPTYSTGTADVLLIKYANGTKDVLNAGRLSAGTAKSALASTSGVTSSSANPTVTKLLYHHGLFSRYFINEAGEPIDRSLVRTALADHPDALRAYRRGQSLNRWSYITAGSAVALLGAGAVVALAGDGGFRQAENSRESGKNAPPVTDNSGRTENGFGRGGDHGPAEVGVSLAGGGILLGVAALILDNRATVQFRRAADRYNTHQQTSLRIGPSSRGIGIGLALQF